VTGPLYRYQGCYTDSAGPYFRGRRSLPQVLDNLREGIGIDECAAAARSRGFPVFALRWTGQCFFGSMADVARLQDTQKLSDDSCDDLPCSTSAGCKGNTNKVYLLIGAPSANTLWVSNDIDTPKCTPIACLSAMISEGNLEFLWHACKLSARSTNMDVLKYRHG
jgi:hypothetical protein